MTFIFKIRIYNNDFNEKKLSLSFKGCDEVEIDTGDGKHHLVKIDHSKTEATKFNHNYDSYGYFTIKMTFRGENPVEIINFSRSYMKFIEVLKWTGYPIG